MGNSTSKSKRISLRTKTMLVLLLTVVIAITCVYAVADKLTLENYKNLEKKVTITNLNRMNALLTERIAALQMQTSDWASRDDTYQYMTDQNKEYVSSDLDTKTLVNLGINAMLFVDKAGNITYLKLIDLKSKNTMTLTQDMTQMIVSAIKEKQSDFYHSFSGVASFGGISVIMSGDPIVSAKANGQSNGFLVFCRIMDEQFINSLAQSASMDITLKTLTDIKLPQSSEYKLLSAGALYSVENVNSHQMKGNVVVSDIVGTPAVMFTALLPRDIYQQGLHSIHTFNIWAMSLILLAGGVLLLLLELLVVRRLTRLSKSVTKIKRENLNERVLLSGNDEISSLGYNINQMLDSIEQTQTDLKNSNELLEQKVEKRTAELARANEWLRQDILKREEIENSLRESEEKYRTMFESCKEAIILTTPDTKIQSANPATATMLGYDGPDEIIGKSFSDLCESRTQLKIFRAQLMHRGYLNDMEIALKKKDGSLVITLGSAIVHRDQQGKLLNVQSLLMNITERKQAEEALKHSQQNYKTLTENIPQKIFYKDKNSVYVSCNNNFATDLKINAEEIVGKTDYYFYPEELAKKHTDDDRRVMESNITEVIEERWVKDGKDLIIETVRTPVKNEEGNVVGVLGIFQDITERKRMEEQLILTDRLASIGEMASGLAHELNNPLTSVIGLSQLVVESGPPAEIKEDVEVIYQEAQRAANVIKNLLSFAHKHAPFKKPVQMNSVIADVLKLRAYEQRINNITVKCNLDPQLPTVMADYFQMQQIFLNIILNAEQAMVEAHGNGTLNIVSERVNGNIRLTLSDDGPGISRENLTHIFDPFFTTKDVGKGTGLGLSICYGIVTAHNGHIYAKSEAGQGASFVIELPVETANCKEVLN